MPAERVDFGGLRGEALALHNDIVRLRADCVALKGDASQAGTAGAAAFRAQRQEASQLQKSVSSVTGEISKQFALHKLVQASIKEVRKGFDELVEGAIKFNAAKESAFDSNSFNNLMSTLKSGLATALGRGGEGLFKQIKGLIDDLGTIARSETFRAAIQSIDDGLAAAVREARILVQTLDADTLLEIANAIGASVRGIGAILGPVVSGLVAGLGDLAKILRAVSAEFGKKLFGDDFPVTLATLAEIVTVIVGMAIPLAAIAAIFTAIPVSILVALGAIAAFAAGVVTITDEATGLQLRFGTIRDLIGTGIVFAIELAVAKLKVLSAQARVLANATLGDETGELKANADLAKANELVASLAQAHKELKTEIISNNSSADTFAQAFAKAAQSGVQSITEFIHKDLPNLTDQLKTRAKEDPVEIPVHLDTSKVTGNQPGGLASSNTGPIEEAVRKDLEATAPVVQGFVQIFADTIADALDPNRPGKKSIKKRFEEFFKSLPLLLLQAFAGGGKQGAEPSVGRASGGQVPGSGVASLAHFMAPRGFSFGGRPSGLASSDTVPAWLTPGEWVMRLSAVRKYGPRLMGLLNAGLIDPRLLSVLVGGTARMQRPSGGGYASGGSVSGVSSPSVQPLPVLVASKQQAEALFSAGDGSALVAAAARNRSELRAVLGL